tara:strand:+ start:47 stop:730 length:684 start_codon:yes stop_codon:yes gene_type:complete
MKILSFDVGIKNLAYCLIDDQHYTIEDWGVINISVDPVCCHCNKTNGKQCDKTAKFVCDDDFYLCSTHKLQKTYKDKKTKSVRKSKNPILELGKNMVEKLTKKPNFLEVNTVLIENQPALKNPTMKSVQMILFSYFLINGVKDDTKPVENIEMINARNKLKAYKGEPIECNIKDKYKKTKFLGIEYCKNMIQENKKIQEKYKDIFESSKKQDDLSDAYLQGIYWLTK